MAYKQYGNADLYNMYNSVQRKSEKELKTDGSKLNLLYYCHNVRNYHKEQVKKRILSLSFHDYVCAGSGNVSIF